MTAQAKEGSSRAPIRAGTLVVLGLFAVLAVGWFWYRPHIPPAWLHALASDIALRATTDPNAPAPEDMRQATPRNLADSPYICPAKVIALPWDKMIVVAKAEGLIANPVLGRATWPQNDFEAKAAQLARDNRYQLIVLLKDNAVVDAQLFYTFWADLNGIARPEGFTRDEAIFTADSKSGVYVVSAAVDKPPETCR